MINGSLEKDLDRFLLNYASSCNWCEPGLAADEQEDNTHLALIYPVPGEGNEALASEIQTTRFHAKDEHCVKTIHTKMPVLPLYIISGYCLKVIVLFLFKWWLRRKIVSGQCIYQTILELRPLLHEGAEAKRCVDVLLGPKIEASSQFLGLTRGIPLPCEREDVCAAENRFEKGDMKEHLIFNLIHVSYS